MSGVELPPVLTVPELAGLLRVSKRLVYKLAETGELRVLRLGNAIRVPRAEALRLLGEQAPESPSEPGDAAVVVLRREQG